jgi:hypothetical protein
MQSSALLRIALLFLTATSLGAQGTRGIQSGTRPARIVIRNAMVVIGNGTPASGPYDIVIEGNTIADVVALDPVAVRDGRAREYAMTPYTPSAALPSFRCASRLGSSPRPGMRIDVSE